MYIQFINTLYKPDGSTNITSKTTMLYNITFYASKTFPLLQWRRYVVARQCKCTASLMQCTATCTASVVETFEYIWKEMTAISHYTNQSICVTGCLEICKAVLLRVTYLFAYMLIFWQREQVTGICGVYQAISWCLLRGQQTYTYCMHTARNFCSSGTFLQLLETDKDSFANDYVRFATI